MAGDPRYDVIVVGAGPAGSVAAYLLASAGRRTLLLEKEKLPRYKACGGALVRRAWEALPFSLDGEARVIECRVSRLRLTNDLRDPLVIERDIPPIAMTMRSALDAYLAGRAAAAGAELREGVAVRGVVESEGSVRCETSEGAFTAGFLVGADGANSIVRRSSRNFRSLKFGVAMEAELYMKSGRVPADYSGELNFDFQVLPHGYGWIFPKADHVSAGVFTMRTRFPQIRQCLDRYVARKGLAVQVARSHIEGHLIPLGPPAGRLNSARVLLAGDAAGLVDPLTGEGISYAIRSGTLAAEALIGQRPDSYTDAVRSTLAPEIRLGRILARLLYAQPSLLYRALTRKKLFSERVVDVFEGKTTYGNLLRKILRKPFKLV